VTNPSDRWQPVVLKGGLSKDGDAAHAAEDAEPIRTGTNVYADSIWGEQPEEILEFQRTTDPYSNMLPGISNIRAASTIGRGMEVGKRGNRLIMAVSIVMLVALLLPLALAVLDQLVH
jgi:hypothetical protein